MPKLNKENAVVELVKRVPELKPAYDSEMKYYGEISNYVFFGSLLSKFIVERHIKSDVESTDNVLNTLFAYIEECAETDNPELRDLILAGFLESFSAILDDNPELKIYLGTKTSELLNLFE